MTSRSERIEKKARDLVDALDHWTITANVDGARDALRAALSAPPEEQGGRPPCHCTHEAGDSPCPRHGMDEPEPPPPGPAAPVIRNLTRPPSSPDPGRPRYPIPGGLPTPEDPWVVGVVASTSTEWGCSKCGQDLALHQADLRCQVGDGEYTRSAPSPDPGARPPSEPATCTCPWGSENGHSADCPACPAHEPAPVPSAGGETRCPKCGGPTQFAMLHPNGSGRRFYVCNDSTCGGGGVWLPAQPQTKEGAP